MSALSQSLLKVASVWRAEGVEVLPPPDVPEVRELLAATQRQITPDVFEVYCTIGGMAAGQMDNACFAMWPLQDVVHRNSEHASPSLFFGDYLIDSHLLCFVPLGNTSSVAQSYDCVSPTPADSRMPVGAFFKAYSESDPADRERMIC